MNLKSVLPEGEFATTDKGHKIHYLERGTGKPVVFLHGSGPGASSWSNFKQNINAFVDAGFRTILIDHIGYGLSSKPADEIYTLDLFIDCLKQTLDHIGVSKCALVGNSLGGAIAIGFALKYPKMISHLILMGPGGVEEREVYFEMEGITTMMKSFLSEEGIDRERMASLLSLILYDTDYITELLLDERMEVLASQVKECLSTMQVPNLEPRLQELNCPLLGFWGMNDKFCPPSGAKIIMERCKNARFILQSECGHWFMVEHAALFDRMCVDFLTNS